MAVASFVVRNVIFIALVTGWPDQGGDQGDSGWCYGRRYFVLSTYEPKRLCTYTPYGGDIAGTRTIILLARWIYRQTTAITCIIDFAADSVVLYSCSHRAKKNSVVGVLLRP